MNSILTKEVHVCHRNILSTDDNLIIFMNENKVNHVQRGEVIGLSVWHYHCPHKNSQYVKNDKK